MLWTNEKTIEDALTLPEGRYCADFGIRIEQSVAPDRVIEAAQAIKNAGVQVTVATQAAILVKAQELGVAFTDWAPLKLM